MSPEFAAAMGRATAPKDTLHDMLQEVLDRGHRGPHRIASIEQRPSPMRSTVVLEELDVHLDNGVVLPMMLKDLSPGARLDAHALGWAKPELLYDPLREIEAYRSILAPASRGTPIFYGADVNVEEQRYRLFLERVHGVELNQVGLETWLHVASWLGETHRALAVVEPPPAVTGHLMRYDQAFFRLWPARAVDHLDRSGGPLPADGRHLLRRIIARYEKVVGCLASLPKTIIHGDFYAMNVLVGVDDQASRVCPVDWEMAGLGPGIIDLASLTAGEWSDGERSALLHAYIAGSQAESPRDTVVQGDDLQDVLDYAHLHLAMRNLGWSEERMPRPYTAAGWLEQAARVAARLKLL